MTNPTRTVDLTAIGQHSEIILRGGDARAQDARQRMQEAYVRPDLAYPDVTGLSVLFRPGASLDDLAREGNFPHSKLSHALVAQITSGLAMSGYEPVLYVTPTLELRDHHTLAVAIAGSGQVTLVLPDAAADALIRALTVSDNPYRRQ